jgi:formate/nitrite transporter
MSFQTPKQVFHSIAESGAIKIQTGTIKVLLLGFLAGAYIAFGGLLAIKIGAGIPEIKESNPGLAALIFGGVFPVGLMLVVMAGAELFTGNTALLIPALRKKSVTYKQIAKNWSLSYLGNFIGSVFVAYFFVSITGVLSNDPWRSATIDIAESKVSQEFVTLFFKGIACNWLVCLAVWLTVSSNQVSGKILGIWFPIMTFVALGFEHSIANMFFIPLGILQGADVTWVDFLVDNLIPVTLGNIIGGTVFVGMIYSYVFSDSK